MYYYVTPIQSSEYNSWFIVHFLPFCYYYYEIFQAKIGDILLLLRFVFLILLYVYHTKLGVLLLLFRQVFVIKISEYKFGDLLFLSRFLLPFHTHFHPRPKFVQRNTQIQPCCSSLMALQIYLNVPSIFILVRSWCIDETFSLAIF